MSEIRNEYKLTNPQITPAIFAFELYFVTVESSGLTIWLQSPQRRRKGRRRRRKRLFTSGGRKKSRCLKASNHLGFRDEDLGSQKASNQAKLALATCVCTPARILLLQGTPRGEKSLNVIRGSPAARASWMFSGRCCRAGRNGVFTGLAGQNTVFFGAKCDNQRGCGSEG